MSVNNFEDAADFAARNVSYYECNSEEYIEEYSAVEIE
jgi:hypothetical protein